MRTPTTFIAVLLNALLLLSISAMAASELKWETTLIEVEPTFEQKEVTVSFQFENISNQPITIDSTKTSCGCTVASLEKTTYEPGESGEVSAVFEIGQLVGLQTKLITVFTNGSKEPTDSLTLKVNIPQAVTLKPRIRMWKIGQGEINEQTIQISIHESLDIEITSLIPINEDGAQFDYTLEKSEKPGDYLLTLKPKSLEVQLRGRFNLGSDNDRDHTLQKHPIYAFVR